MSTPFEQSRVEETSDTTDKQADTSKPSIPATNSSEPESEEEYDLSPDKLEETAKRPALVLAQKTPVPSEDEVEPPAQVSEQDHKETVIPETPPIETDETTQAHQGGRDQSHPYRNRPPLFFNIHQISQARPYHLYVSFLKHRALTRRILSILLLALIFISMISLWRDVHDTHLLLYTLNPVNGNMMAQQDLGGGYTGPTHLTNAVQNGPSMLVGAQSAQGKVVQQQQVFVLDDTSWQVTNSFSAPLTHATLTPTPGGNVLLSYAQGLEMLAGDGSVRWQRAAQMPTRGAHPFQPAIDAHTIYTVLSVSKGEIAAINIQRGTTHWEQKLNDTFAYAPPPVLAGNTLYFAADHQIYALDRTNGHVLWHTFFPTRTLLVTHDGRLIAAGAQGIVAFGATSGTPLWTFSGQSPGASLDKQTNAQFYEALLSGSTIYASGISWNVPEIREQTWLYALNASSGTLRWSTQVGEGAASADGGRVFLPVVASNMVLLEQLSGDGSLSLIAYSVLNGRLRWRAAFADVQTGMLLQPTGNTLAFLAMQTSPQTVLHLFTPIRLLLVLSAVISLLALLYLWLFPLALWKRRLIFLRRQVPRYLLFPLRLLLRLWRRSRLLFSLLCLAILLGAGAAEYLQLISIQTYINQAGASSGRLQWQQPAGSSILAGADSQGSFVIHNQLIALDAHGNPRWKTFTSQGTFSLPAIRTASGTLLVALQGPAQQQYHLAPADPAYPEPMASSFVLYLLDRASGRVLWKNIMGQAGDSQQISVLAADSNFIYLASHTRITNTSIHAAQLIALDPHSGAIAWRISGPREHKLLDNGVLLPHGRLIYWQVAYTIYAIDTQTAQIQWRTGIDENSPSVLLQEEREMALGSGVLVVGRSDTFHALDLLSGIERWTFDSPGVYTASAPAGIVTTRSAFILYSANTLEAIDGRNQRVLWKQGPFASIQQVSLSDDQSLLYVLETSSLDGNTRSQALTALDIKSGGARWTFQPTAQARFFAPGLGYFHLVSGSIFTTACATASCSRETLYALNATTGALLWKFEATQVSSVQVSSDGSTVLFQTQNNILDTLKAQFHL